VPAHTGPPGGAPPGAISGVLERPVARSAASVLGVSRPREERMRAAGARRVGRALVPAGDVPAIREARAPRPLPGDPAPDRPLVLAAGRLAAQKGLGTVLNAAARRGRPQPPPAPGVPAASP